jgi:2-polyprenyl-3-methyl-5-hydroxy-6-metoxy-1,4-benzoquinol methylase
MTDYFSHTRSEMMAYVPTTAKKILEVGCGEGNFGHQLILRQSAEVWGIEPNPSAVEIAITRLSKVICDNFTPSLDLPSNYFDCIIFNDVLEHMYDPWGALNYAKKLLTSGNSRVVSSIPNFRNWENIKEIVVNKKWDYKEEGILDKTHIRYFTKDSIIKLFKNLGYKIDTIEGINPTTDWSYKILNFILANNISDMSFLQFAIVAGLA